MSKLEKEIKIATVKGHRAMELICISLFNKFKVEAGGVAIKYDDTIATYAIHGTRFGNRPWTSTFKALVAPYVEGLIDAYISLSVTEAVSHVNMEESKSILTC